MIDCKNLMKTSRHGTAMCLIIRSMSTLVNCLKRKSYLIFIAIISDAKIMSLLMKMKV